MAEEFKASSFATGPDSGADVSDVYDASAIQAINTTTSAQVTTSNSYTDLTPMQAAGRGIGTVGTATNAADAAALKEANSVLPAKVKLKDILSGDMSIADAVATTKRIKGTAPSNVYSGLSGEDLGFLINQSDKLTTTALLKDKKLTSEDLKNANGVDYVVLAALGVFTIRQAMQKRNDTLLMSIIGGTKLPSLFKDAVLESILDMAAEYGLEGVVSSLFEIIGENLPKAKRSQTVRSLLSGFRFSTKPVVTELSAGERSLIVSATDFFNVGGTTADVIEEIIGVAVYEEEYPSKKEQASRLITTLGKIDGRWDTGLRSGETESRLDNFRYASSDARKALLMDERTIIPMSVYLSQRVYPISWRPIARQKYPRLYA